jgi:hypothetical protein
MHLSEFIKLNFTYCLKLSSTIGEKFINSFQEISGLAGFNWTHLDLNFAHLHVQMILFDK